MHVLERCKSRVRPTVVDEVARARVVERFGCKLRAKMQEIAATDVLAFRATSEALKAAIFALVESVWSVSQPAREVSFDCRLILSESRFVLRM